MINFYFTSTLMFSSKHAGTKKGWGATHIEFSSRFGWNFFTNTRYWDKEMKELLPPVFKLRIRTVEYYNEVMERTWNFMEKKNEYYPKFDGEAQKEGNEHTRLIHVVYRFPLLTITNAYHTELDELRRKEFLRELNKPS